MLLPSVPNGMTLSSLGEKNIDMSVSIPPKFPYFIRNYMFLIQSGVVFMLTICSNLCNNLKNNNLTFIWEISFLEIIRKCEQNYLIRIFGHLYVDSGSHCLNIPVFLGHKVPKNSY